VTTGRSGRFIALCAKAGSAAKSNARVTLDLQLGIPSAVTPFTRALTATMRVPGHQRAESVAVLVAVGLRFLTDLERVPFPEGRPLLMLHDPPGGSSFSSFQNVLATATYVGFAVAESSLPLPPPPPPPPLRSRLGGSVDGLQF